jgi:predicted nucleic acid-binding protein
MGLIIDTTVLIAAEKGKFDVGSFLLAESSTEFAMAAITASELLVGVLRGKPPVSESRRLFVETLLSRFPVISFDLSVARVHAQLSSQLAALGKPVGTHDLLIAATAVATGYEVLTFDLRSFPNIPGVRFRVPA